eukprot:1177492-Prorocentrum_minimum.AAC.6
MTVPRPARGGSARSRKRAGGPVHPSEWTKVVEPSSLVVDSESHSLTSKLSQKWSPLYPPPPCANACDRNIERPSVSIVLETEVRLTKSGSATSATGFRQSNVKRSWPFDRLPCTSRPEMVAFMFDVTVCLCSTRSSGSMRALASI